jgi:tetratricopeptide (TPR) repeat protein
MSTPCDSRLTLVEECIHKCRAALLASDMSLANSNQMDLEQELAEALVKAHDLSGCQDLDRLQEAMSLYEGTLGADSVEHAHRRARALTGLGSALWRQCEFHDEDAMRLNRSIALLREALDISPIGHSARADTLYALALALHTGFEQLGFPEYISESVLLHRDALMLRPLCHPNRDESLNGLAIALDRLFVKQGGLHLLDEAIDLHRQALLLRVPGHPRRATSLNNLAIALQRSFQQRGGRENLAQVIALHREVLTLRMARSPFWAHTSNNLAVALFDYFVYYGGFDALAESTTWARQALLLLPPGNSNRGKWTNNLACALRKTFEQQGNGEALLEAIALHREALFLHPPGHADRDTSLDGLANALQIKSGGSMEDLHDAIALHREALQLRPVSHPLRDETQHHLAMALETSYRRHHSTEILAEAVSLHRQALAVRVNPHPNRHLSLMGLASSLVQFAAASKELHTWEEAASLYEEALTLCPRGHPLRARLYSRLGRCLLTPTSPIFDFDLGVERLLEGLSDGFAPVKERLHGASEDLRAAEQACNSALNDTDTTSQARRHYDMLKLYQEAIQLLPRMANFGMDHQTRYCTLIGSDEISRNAATRALLLGRVSQAVEMLEEGRGIFWSQALRLRASGLDDVPELDRLKLQSLFRALDDGARGLTSASAQQSPAHREQALESQRQLNLQAEALIAQIRSYSGLQRFLMPAAFDMLLRTLPHGFVIIVNASSLGCHALLLSRDHGSVENLELPLPQSLNIELSTIRASLPRDVSSETQNVMAASRAMRICRAEPQGFEDLLAMLWTTVVNPIVRKLGLKVSIVFVSESRMMTCD